MLKNIFQALLVFSCLVVTSNVTANPIDLFSHQCITYSPSFKTKPFSSQLDQSPQAYQTLFSQFEHNLLGLNNLNDRLRYYRNVKLSSQQQQLLLQCQIHISDTLNQGINAKSVFLTSAVLKQLPLRYQHVAQTLLKQRMNAEQIQQKSSRLVAQTMYQQVFKQSKAEIKINHKNCQLNNKSTLISTKDIANYLINQPLSSCRKSVWIQYQLRSKELNLPSLEYLWTQLQLDATKEGFKNDTAKQLAKISLTKQQALSFINNQNHSLADTSPIAPWSFARELFQHPAKLKPIIMTGHQLLLNAMQPLSELGLRFELIPIEEHNSNPTLHVQQHKPFIYRLWHKNRLLGELDVFFSKDISKPQGSLIKKTIIGQQYGQWILTLPTAPLKIANQRKLISLLSQSITSLAQANWFYTSSMQNQRQISLGVGKLWLEHFINERIHPTFKNHIYAQKQKFKNNWQLYRTRLAIEFFSLNQLNWHSTEFQSFSYKMANKFHLYFGEHWAEASDTLFSFSSLVNERALSILPHWQQALAILINKQHRKELTNQGIFELLVINNSEKSFEQQLAALLGGQTDTNNLIRRIANAN